MNPRRPSVGRGQRAGRRLSPSFAHGPPVGEQLRRTIVRELKPVGVVEKFIAARVACAIEAFDTALAPGSLKVDPAERSRDEIVGELYDALGQLRALQAHRRK